MLRNIISAKCVGIQAVPVNVEVNISSGLGIHLVGLADAAVKESLLRTVTALQSMGFRIPGKKIVINLAPADMHKKGSGYDLPIALGIIASSEQDELPGTGKYVIMGELGLDASVRDIPGALPIVDMAGSMGLGCILPAGSAMEALENFQLLYPDEKVYLVFEEPYFKVKVGNFTSRIEASLYLKSIKADYPYAFVIKDVLDMEEYLKEEKTE